jgi:flavin reductase (DIM6/NTAB) family NADH-FMN oxidoreductase RutF
VHYDTRANDHGLSHDPFKALVSPRPIGWISTISEQGIRNLAPYSFFNAVSDRPPMVMFSSAGRKDSLKNIEATGEFVCSFVSNALCEAMNMSSAPVQPGVDEFQLAGLTPAASVHVKPPRVAESPAALECRLWKIDPLPTPPGKSGPAYWLVFGEVIGVYIDDRYLTDGRFDVAAAEPLARLGYMDYAVVNRQSLFSLNRPRVSEKGDTATLVPGSWDGVYR